jgi:hypothetical protein
MVAQYGASHVSASGKPLNTIEAAFFSDQHLLQIMCFLALIVVINATILS